MAPITSHDYKLMTSPIYREEVSSQIPAVRLLRAMGWAYLPASEALRLRGGRLAGVLLEPVLMDWLRRNNRVRYKGQALPFEEGNIAAAVQALKAVALDGLVPTNKKIYDLLCLGKSFEQVIDGDRKSFTLRYIDFERPERNVFHLVEEFAVERVGRREARKPDEEELEARSGDPALNVRAENVRRPDIVLFVNGIPLGVIECKRPDLKNPIKEAISQHLRNQRNEEIPHLFQFAQILLAVAVREAQYGTVDTPAKFWSVWKEQLGKTDEDRLGELVNSEPEPIAEDPVFEGRSGVVREHFADYGERRLTEQDRTLFALCRPERFLEMMYRFVVFDAGRKKLARWQQFFCVRDTLDRVKQRDEEGRRRGGTVWHTQGSGKSLTMVMLAKALALAPDIVNPRIVLVTDRVDLDDQIYGTFQACDMEPQRAGTGEHLGTLLESERATIITTVLDKFETVIARKSYRNAADNIFVLVDESHRSHYGARNAQLRRALPMACHIGFTGTPLLAKDKSTMDRFGGLIGRAYTIKDAVADGAVVPLLYEGRDVELSVDKDQIDRWFDRVTMNLSEEQKADLKKKFATTGQLHRAEQKVRCIAWDVATHFRDTWQGSGLKGQLVAPNKDTALRYKEFLDETGLVTSEVIISGPDDREGNEEVEDPTEKVQKFWKKMMDRYGSEENYNRSLIGAFKNGDEPEIIIVVSKLLTGFDAPKNVVLYLARPLKDHTLLQAIARVNRLCDGKEFGYILDYVGVLGKLDEALDLYGKLAEFDPEDIEGTATDVSVEIEKLGQRHSDLWDVFKGVRNRKDQEEFEQALADEALRLQFYERLAAFARTLQIALASAKFHDATHPEKVARYRGDLKFFVELRASVRQRYAETVDFGEYEKRIQMLVDRHVGAGDVKQIVPLVSIFDDEAFQAAVEERHSPRSKADLIASQTKRTISERWEEDPALYRKFSEMLQAAIDEFRAGRLSDVDFLAKVQKVRESVVNRTDENIPPELRQREVARAFYGILRESLGDRANSAGDRFGIEASLGAEKAIRELVIVNWAANEDVVKRMAIAVEELLLDPKSPHGVALDFSDVDLLVARFIDVARVHIR